MSAKYPCLRAAISELIAKIPGDNIDFRQNVCNQLIHAALGTVSPEIAGRDRLPITRTASKYDAELIQYDLIHTMHRAMKMLGIEQWAAMRIALDVIDALRAARVRVNQVQLLLDPSYKKAARKKAFSALLEKLEGNETNGFLLPTTATLAIVKGLVPMPDTSWEGRFDLAANFPRRGRSQLVELVNSSECYLWQFPPASNESTSWAVHDRYLSESRIHSAEMGMGFSIIQAPWRRSDWPSKTDFYNQYSLYSPMWNCQRIVSTLEALSWRLGNLHHSTIRDGRYGAAEFSELLPDGLASLPRIHGCHECRTLYVDKSAECAGVPNNCRCGKRVTTMPAINQTAPTN